MRDYLYSVQSLFCIFHQLLTAIGKIRFWYNVFIAATPPNIANAPTTAIPTGVVTNASVAAPKANDPILKAQLEQQKPTIHHY